MGARGKLEDRDHDAEGPLRRCAVSRTQKPPEELIRFVAGPDRVVVPDLARRLPGRGVWVDATRVAVSEAVRRKAFARSLQRNVEAPRDLPDVVERLMQRRLADAVSIANKAGLVVAGFAKVEEVIAAGRAVVLIHAADAATDGVEKLDRKFKGLAGLGDSDTEIVRELSGAELSLAMGRPNVVHAAAAEGGASRRLIDEARRLGRYRRGGAPDGGSRPGLEPTQDVHD
jgi:predicted RNA-binding protein YlxR (DUF448 family)